MSRASNTYVVAQDDHPGHILAVFTVKWEAKEWLRGQDLRGLCVLRFPDGRYLKDRLYTAAWSAEEFLAS